MKINEVIGPNIDTGVIEKIIQSEFFKVNYEQMVKYAIKNDKPLSEMYPTLLFHGTSTLNKDYGILDFKMRSRPRDSSPYIHNLINEKTKEEYGLPLRNLIFATTKRHVADDFGMRIILFPIGTYRLFVSEDTSDFTEKYAVSAFGTDLYQHIIEPISHNIPRPLMMRLYDDELIKAMNTIANDSDLKNFEELFIIKATEITKENDIKVNVEKIAKTIVDRFKTYMETSAEEYIDTITETKEVVKTEDEYMVYGQGLAYIDAEHYLGEFFELLVKIYKEKYYEN